MEPPWWLNWLADLASISGIGFTAIVPVIASVIGWLLGYLPPTPRPKPRSHPASRAHTGRPHVSLKDEAFGSAYRALVGAHKTVAQLFWQTVGGLVFLVIACGIYVSMGPPGDKLLRAIMTLDFYGICILTAVIVVSMIRLHLRIRYENELRASEHEY